MVLWLLAGLRRRMRVPFLEFWKTARPVALPRRRWQAPPAALVCLIAATLAMILSAAGPRIGSGPISTRRVRVIVDRGITMSDPALFARTMESARLALDGRVDPANVRWLNIPTQAQGDWSAARQWAATAVNTRTMLLAAANIERREDQLVLILSNQSLNLDHPQLVQFAAADPFEDVAITHIGAASDGHAGGQVMVHLLNHSRRQSIDLEIQSAGQTTVHSIALAPGVDQHDAFVNLSELGPTVQATLRIKDSIPLDDSAFLVRQGENIEIEPLFQMPLELRRMVEIYQRQQQGVGPRQTILFVRAGAEAADDVPAVILPSNQSSGDGPIRAADHPITAQVQWQRWAWKLTVESPPAGWTPLVTIGQKTALAITEHPVRRVWVGVSSEEFSRSTQFVMFWTDVLDYLSQGRLQYAAQRVHQLGGDWKCLTSPDADVPAGLHPGIWQSDDRRIALNAEPFDWPRPAPFSDPSRQMGRALNSHRAGRFDAGGLLMPAALVLLACAALLWPAGRLTRPGGTRTV